MTWNEECRLWFHGKYPTDDTELENLVQELGVPETELWLGLGIDTAEARK